MDWFPIFLKVVAAIYGAYILGYYLGRGFSQALIKTLNQIGVNYGKSKRQKEKEKG